MVIDNDSNDDNHHGNDGVEHDNDDDNDHDDNDVHREKGNSNSLPPGELGVDTRIWSTQSCNGDGHDDDGHDDDGHDDDRDDHDRKKVLSFSLWKRNLYAGNVCSKM